MIGFGEKYSIGDLNLQSTHDLPTNRLGGKEESKVSSRGMNFCGGIYTMNELFEVLFGQKKSLELNNKNTLNEKE